MHYMSALDMGAPLDWLVGTYIREAVTVAGFVTLDIFKLLK